MTTACVLLLSLGAAIWDWRVRRIPNWLCLSGLLAGFVLNDWRFALGGVGLALAIHLPLFALRATGGGDVKLMAALGALLGVDVWLRVFLISAILGGVIALGMVFWRGALRETFKRLWMILRSLGRGVAPYRERPELDVTTGLGNTLPRGVVVAIAVVVWLGYSKFRTSF
ncbi:MAG: prepilin peptidase [Acidobacteria bacterium]|nr:prepilin peptidase [Acidobacteriota bacterium]